MIETMTQSIATYDVASHIPADQSLRHLSESRSAYHTRPKLPLNYAGLWPILAAQNASVDLLFTTADLFELQGISGAVTGGWGFPQRVNQVFGMVTISPAIQTWRVEPARRISLAEARHLAITALLDAEERRQEERKRESAFWAAQEDAL